ncbi:hypothetical protein PFICI_12990 [Pestalotiopsis fici W106-1]|uniref:Sin3-associated polypeptide Sap18 n=1 Tax=Pestalotiopsis fici (strain W106-1 / CGMCC3.15140) TaxID=1229662 RepID=W3WT91_PESFW|nr:uncharacterized protein PFICI_12990 [Pestalotiopsis fici W106-1]ETS76046.1 hypothetical protein PFICI_12990 [Pestalotiopsis fici W106-1]
MDRRANPPSALRIFYRTGAFHRPDEFFAPELLPHLTVHTWPSCTLHELSHHVAFTAPSILPDPVIGTRLSFRLIYPDARGAAGPSAHAQGPKYMIKDLGSIVIGDGEPGLEAEDTSSLHRDLGEADGLRGSVDGGEGLKTLAEARFVVGDYISLAILPPLEDGSIAPPSAARMGRGAGAGEAGTVVGRAPGHLGRDRFHDSGGRRGGRAGRSDGFGWGSRGGAGGSASAGGSFGVPRGEWRRGEQLPDVPRERGGSSGEWRGLDSQSNRSHARGRGRGRW